VERNFGTAQDRLVKGMRVAGVKTLEEANKYLEETYLVWWERELTVEPVNSDNAHRPLDKSHSLEASLSHVETRQVRNDYTIPLDAELYQIERQAVVSGLRKASVRVEKRLDGSIAVRFGERYLPVTLCIAATKTKTQPVKEVVHRRPPPATRQRLVQELRPEEGTEDMASGIEPGTAPVGAFSRHGGICRSDVSNAFCKPGPTYRFPVGAEPDYEARRKKTRLLIVATSSGRLFPDRVARQCGAV
jgi:hypothetical protein